ncbi:MAG: mechanosensitive ion channel family protein [Armatimonadota bacterium]|nr:MAG: mechanosensitive ion channel family protein [Armatimonadota bacterium]
MPNWLQSENAQDALISIGILVVAAILAALARVIFVPILRKVTARTKTDLDDVILRALNRPIAWAILLAGLYAALINLDFWSAKQLGFLRVGSKVAGTILVIYAALRVFNVIAQWYTDVAVEKSPRPREVQAQAVVGRKVINILILVAGILIILQQMNQPIGPLVGALGLGGLAVALALQDTLSNLFAGVYMMVDRPVTVGDFIKLESGEEGFVEEVGWRNTKVRMWANNIVVIPNSKLAQSVVTNYYLPQQELSVYISCGVAYDSDLEHVERVSVQVGKEVMERVPGSAADWTPVVRFKEFADFSINFVVVLRVKDFAAQYLLGHEYVKALHRRFAEEGIEIPFPIRTVIMRTPKPTVERPLMEAERVSPGGVEVGEGEGPGGPGGGV